MRNVYFKITGNTN